MKPMSIIAGVSAVVALIGGIIAFDSRYAKQEDFSSKLSDVKDQIIDEMRREVVKNRSVMISAMQREADDLEFQISILERGNQEVPRYMTEKHKLITREIEGLKHED